MALRQKQAVICFDIVDGRSFLTADMSIRCDAEYQQLIYPLAAIAFLFYASINHIWKHGSVQLPKTFSPQHHRAK